MSRTISNLTKSDAAWKRYQDRASGRAFANRTDSRIHSGKVSTAFQTSRVAAIAARAAEEN